MVQQLLETTGIDLQNGGGINELQQFEGHSTEYRIVVFGGLDCEDVILDRHVKSEKRINLLYDDVNILYHVITHLTGAMVKRYVCKGCNKGSRSEVTHKCRDQQCLYVHSTMLIYICSNPV